VCNQEPKGCLNDYTKITICKIELIRVEMIMEYCSAYKAHLARAFHMFFGDTDH
jgi:hypothetical protein